MARVDIDVDDFERLVGCLRYAISKTKESDPGMSRFLEYELTEILGHVTNEQGGAEIAHEIGDILSFIGGNDGR
jgi:hypothetical protein